MNYSHVEEGIMHHKVLTVLIATAVAVLFLRSIKIYCSTHTCSFPFCGFRFICNFLFRLRAVLCFRFSVVLAFRFRVVTVPLLYCLRGT